jgi:HSP20 family protein
MNKLIRWNPNREVSSLWNAFDRMFDDSYAMMDDHARSWGLALDIAENENAYVVKASVPGVSPDDIDITLEKNVLTVSGESRADETINTEEYRLRERRYGTFSRSIRLPVEVDSEAIEADYANGVLTLHIPKTEEVKPKKIAVKVS